MPTALRYALRSFRLRERPSELIRRQKDEWSIAGPQARRHRVPGEARGNALFAGEHTSTHSQGYLNGGVETGERAARQVLNVLG